MFKLESFLRHLIAHPKFGSHDLIQEFLYASEFDYGMIQTRVESKIAYLDDTIRKLFHPYIVDIHSVMQKWKETSVTLENLQILERYCASYSRRFQRSQRGNWTLI
jgi:hypothetical protein